jgi:hypothetical protein
MRAHTRTFQLELVENVDVDGKYAEEGSLGDDVFVDIKQAKECYYIVHDSATLFGFGGSPDDIYEERACGSGTAGSQSPCCENRREWQRRCVL